LNGHAGHHNYSELAVVSLGVHLVAAAVWVGGLLALVVHLRGFPAQLRLAVPRFSAIALCCVVAVGISGVVESVVLLDGWTALWDTERGHLMIAKAVALGVLVVIGFWHRQRTVEQASSGRLGPLLQLAAGELLVMGATIGIAVVLSTTA
jgi:putative copper resistance protein D